ncbi:hypothetical protein R0I52_04390 [Psychrobacter sp. CAM01]|uniref:hypothetical protein n=1 Tax=Psychrobacter sp. CAM01 TaxID=3080335 RepID=UPI00293678E6|nr:hypothetical protein [Psychrobacter sp. CAM01]MDV2859946.1 hypothetical protein [Psychrobacter sp. CAM01]
MFAVIIVILIIWAVMWAFYKFMYPRPPKSMMPQKGDVVTPRTCDFCGNSLAEYRGVLETKPASVTANAAQPSAGSMETDSNVLFFCNYEHQADYHAGKVYDPNA